MKATGVVRRIDDLGRVVIPKEIRKVHRIKEGDPLEIFTDKEGEIILKKYSPIGELTEFASNYAETISKTTGHIACITDKDVFKSKENNEIAIPITQNEGRERIYNSQVIYPIISDGDVIGSVILLAKDQSKKMGEVEDKIAQSAAGFLGNHLGV